jgi:hypothetical protein
MRIKLYKGLNFYKFHKIKNLNVTKKYKKPKYYKYI